MHNAYEHCVKYYFNTLKNVQCCLWGDFLRWRFDVASALKALISFSLLCVTDESTVLL